MEDLKFACPGCGSTSLRVVDSGVTVYRPIVSINSDCSITLGDPNEVDYDNTEESWVECEHCGHELGSVDLIFLTTRSS